MQRKLRTASSILATGLTVCFLAGCQMTGMPEVWNPFETTEKTVDDSTFVSTDANGEEIEFEAPARMAVIWKDSAVSQRGSNGVRGFGGRVYFYDEDDEAVRVNGDLIVYAFDDSDPSKTGASQSTVPDRKYVFEQQDLQKHYSETGMGPSYSIWVPWDKVGGYRKTVSLLPVFKPKSGLIVKAGQSIAVLPGKDPYATASTKDLYEQSAANASLVRQSGGEFLGKHSQAIAAQVSHEQAMEAALSAESLRNRVTTISVPRGMRDRINQGTLMGAITKKEERESVNYNERQGMREIEPVRRASAIPAEPEAPVAQPTDRSNKVFGQPGSFR